MRPTEQAFSDEPNQTLTLESDIEKLANVVIDRGLASPAIFLLEMHKPLVGLVHAISLIASPALSILFGLNKTAKLLELFKSRSNVEKLICKIEELEKNKCRQVKT